MKKSYHSSEVPIRLATTTRRSDDGGTDPAGLPVAAVSIDMRTPSDLGQTYAVQPSQVSPAVMPPHQTSRATTGRTSDQSGRRRHHGRPRTNRATQTATKGMTAHRGATRPAAKKKGASTSSASIATTVAALISTAPPAVLVPARVVMAQSPR